MSKDSCQALATPTEVATVSDSAVPLLYEDNLTGSPADMDYVTSDSAQFVTESIEREAGMV
jgi:hypothetical protein